MAENTLSDHTTVQDDKQIRFGTGGDIRAGWDEAGDGRFEWTDIAAVLLGSLDTSGNIGIIGNLAIEEGRGIDGGGVLLLEYEDAVDSVVRSPDGNTNARLNLEALGNMQLFIDVNNDSVNRFFSWGKDATHAGAPTTLMTLDEPGLLSVLLGDIHIVAGNLIVGGGQVGPTADGDLMELAADLLTLNGVLEIRDATTGGEIKLISTDTTITANVLGSVFWGATDSDETNLEAAIIRAVSTEAWGVGATGCEVQVHATANGTNSSALVATFGQDKSLTLEGLLRFGSASRIGWAKITANNITQGNGTHSGTTGGGGGLVGDIATAHDGNFYHIDEVALDPGFELTIEFVSVTAFNWVNIYASYDGATTHPVQISLWNFNTTTWDGFSAFAVSQAEVATAGEYTLENHDFIVPDDTNYIGTGGDDGDVRVRIRHAATGNAAHDLDIDVVSLYR